ncbi:exonuclease SbcCD subunit D C-terminal domain-containing protein [Halomonas sp. PR-M31]|uniref:exonuclease SbcCD subunit D C-terminal domain-containing protein n=1 Tax=Halomonas sp. PR-M31 TaxID=1471202 RepID=UPI0006517CB0|nr:exonuclease SbcCD subunit D C-terminal domain-containing protein [Halomonas sp. PR-M31]
MKFFHTADWHLGQTFHGQERHVEHRAFLDWLLETLAIRQPDALLIAGDIFDVVNPSLRAQELLFEFIVGAHERLPQLEIVMIAGNHDSGNRIELPAPLMKRLNTHARGRVQWRDDGELDSERLLIPLHNESGEIRAWCLALPFLRPAEVTGRGSTETSAQGNDHRNDYVTGISRVHEQLIEAARKRRIQGQALIAMSHAHLRGAAVSEDSERPIVIGGEESISATLFSEDIAYVALGHLHRAQKVGEERIRYSGSPLPMDFSEVAYPHQILEVSLEDERLAGIKALPVPRPVAMHRLGPAPLEAIEAKLVALDDDSALSQERWPWLEISVILKEPLPDLRTRIETALKGKALRLLCLKRRLPDADIQRPGTSERLEDIGPRALFARTWEARWGSSPDDAVLADFDRLRQEVLDEEADAGEARP